MSVALLQTSLILTQAERVADMIAKSDELARYRQAEVKMTNHREAEQLTYTVKLKRNRYSQTSLRYGYDHPEVRKAKDEYDEVLQRVEQIPVIEEFQTSQSEVNDLVQGVLKIVMVSMPGDMRLERDTIEVKSGCGTVGGGCGSCRTK